MTEIVLAMVNGLLAGAFIAAAVLSLTLLRDGDADRALPWIASLATAQAVTMAAGAVAIARPAPVPYDIALLTQDVARGACALLIVRTLMAMVPRLQLGWLLRIIAAVTVVRAVVWLPTDLVVHQPLREGAVPAYGVLSASALVYLLGPAVAGILAAWFGDSEVRRILAVIAPLGAAPALVALVFDEGFAQLQLDNLTTAGVGVGILWLIARRATAAVRRKDSLLRRQGRLARFAESAVDADNAEQVREVAQALLRDELATHRLEVDLGVTADESATTTVTVHGRASIVSATAAVPFDEDRRTFVENVLQVVAARADRAAAEAEILHAMTHDPVTELPNQALLVERLAERLATGASAQHTATAVVVIGIGGIGRVASVRGHAAQERFSREASALLSGAIAPDALLAQLSPVTFAIIDDVPADLTAIQLTHRLAALQTTLDVGLARTATLRTTIGAAVATPGAAAPDVLRDAFAALGAAGSGGTTIAIYDTAIGERLRRHAELESELRLAVERGEIEVEYQPIVDVHRRATIGYEALARWYRGGALSPTSEWITIAESNGLIHDIGRHVLTVAARDQAALGVPISVNVSAVQLSHPGFVAVVVDALAGCPPDQVVLEVTESVVVADPTRAASVLQRLRALGIRIALDDFGTSYSSLSSLADLPIDILKVDRAFVDRIDIPSGAVIVAAVVTMANALGMTTIVEGAETQAQLEILAVLGVSAVQGYVVGRPATVRQLTAAEYPRPLPGPRKLAGVRQLRDQRRRAAQ